MNQLRKRGKTWWNTITALLNEEEVRAMSWAQFVERSEAQYVPKVEHQWMQQEFMALQQTTESFSDLNAKFLEMLSFCPIPRGRPMTPLPIHIEMTPLPRHPEMPRKSKSRVVSQVPVCYHCNETGHKKPECPKLKTGKGDGGTNHVIASSSKGPIMVTQGHAHQMNVEEPVITTTVADTYFLDSEPDVVMFDSGATHSFVSRTFINRLGRSIRKLAHPMVVEVADNRTIYITDVYRGCTLEFSGVEFPIDLIPIAMRELCVIVGMDWLDVFDVEIHFRKKQVRV
ncbi:hypothetical protein Lser_V15G27298 [Lactuca serriola]